MKKIITVLTILTIGAGFASYVTAETQEQRVEHYEAHIGTADEAFKALDDKVAEIVVILKNQGEMEFVELEKIHEISYTLEAAIDKLRSSQAVAIDKVDVLDEAIQAIHFSSEKHEEAKTREWFAKLKVAADNIKDISESAVIEKKEFYEIVIKNHKFYPEETTIPAGQKVKLIIDNQDATPEEFESYDLNREKIISGNKKATIFIGPLKAGKYHFFGEFNKDSANGYIIVK